MSHRIDGRLANDLSVEAATTAVTIASGLGATSAYTWLKIPVIGDGGDAMAAVLGATTLPTLLLGGELAVDQDRTYERWARALHHPTVRGLVVGVRVLVANLSLLFYKLAGAAGLNTVDGSAVVKILARLAGVTVWSGD